VTSTDIPEKRTHTKH